MANGQNTQGDAFPTPTPVAGITGAASVTAGIGHIIVQMKNGTLRTWGHDGWGQAGIGTHGYYQMKPATPKLTGVKASFATQNRCFAITQDGKLWFWGPELYKLTGLVKKPQYSPVDITANW
jgi:alpha-tubulin suppressor-like RCC1 family protein